jgi:hypothetical protein
VVSQTLFSFSLVSKNNYVQSQSVVVAVTRLGNPLEIIKMNLDSDPLYGSYVRAFLATLNSNKLLKSGLNELENATKFVDAAYRSVSLRQAVSI